MPLYSVNENDKKSVWINAYIYSNMNQFLASIGFSLILYVEGHFVCM